MLPPAEAMRAIIALICGLGMRIAMTKFVAAGRGTYACESCQKRPRRRRPARRVAKKG